MATRAEIMEKLGEVQHMLNIARHNRKEQEEATDANVARVLALLRLKSEISVEEMSTVLGIGAGYYFKVAKGKKEEFLDEDDDEEDEEETIEDDEEDEDTEEDFFNQNDEEDE